jgi:hypothetical protein
MSQNIAKTKFQIQNHQTKIWANDTPQSLSQSAEEFRAAEPRPQSADENLDVKRANSKTRVPESRTEPDQES